MDNSILFSIESILSRRDPPSPLSAIQQLVDKLPAPRSSHRVLGETPSERDVKNAEAEQTDRIDFNLKSKDLRIRMATPRLWLEP